MIYNHCLLARVVIVIFSCFPCLYVLFILVFLLISYMCAVFTPGRRFLAACFNRGYSVSCLVMCFNCHIFLLWGKILMDGICNGFLYQSEKKKWFLSLPLNDIMTSYGAFRYGMFSGIFLTEPFFYFCSFTSTPDKESNKYYLGPAPLEEMAR